MCGAPPTIPPNADLCFELQLHQLHSLPQPEPEHQLHHHHHPSKAAPQPPQPPQSAGAAAGFTPCPKFAGPRAGQVFKLGGHGIGYYADAAAAPAFEARKSVSFADGPPPGSADARACLSPSAAALRHAELEEAAARQAMRLAPPAPGNLTTLPYKYKGQGDFTRRSFHWL